MLAINTFPKKDITNFESIDGFPDCRSDFLSDYNSTKNRKNQFGNITINEGIYSDLLFLEFTSKENRDAVNERLVHEYKSAILENESIRFQPIKRENNQIGESGATFEHGGKFFIIINPRVGLSEDEGDTDLSRGLYRGLIFDPELYESSSSDIATKKTSIKVEEVLGE